MKAAYIYLMTNSVNGKVYIGKSYNPQERWGDHRKVALGGKEKYPTEFFAIHAALHKYGISNFRFEIIDELESKEDAYKVETQWILLLCSNLKRYGYNCNLGGKGGIVPNEETRQKLIIAANKPEKIKLSSNMMKERHRENPRFLGQLQAKLTETQVLEIRRRYEHKEAGYLKLAKEYGVGQTTIRKVISRKTWSHI